MRLTGRSYFDFGEPGRSVLALRASFGTEPAINIGGIPPDKLFYAGGGGSVRGFVYRAPARATPSTIRWAAPASSRRASSSASASANRSVPWPSSMPAAPIPTSCPISRCSRRESAPASALRYYTDFGPVRVDVGFPLNAREGDPPFGVYVSLGQAF